MLLTTNFVIQTLIIVSVNPISLSVNDMKNQIQIFLQAQIHLA